MTRHITSAWLAAVLAAVAILLTHFAVADTTTCTTNAVTGIVTTGCYTTAQQTNTLVALNAFSDAIPDLLSVWTGGDFCAWAQYVDCFSGEVRVAVALSEATVVGTLPEIVDTVDPAEVLISKIDISYVEGVTGTLPASWSRMAQLISINLGYSGVSGTLPAAWASLTGLQQILLDATDISGTLPAAWSQLTNLQSLGLQQMRLSGPLPESWAALTQLTTLLLNNNVLSGSLPAAWSAMTALTTAALTVNNFCGCVPASWATSGSKLGESGVVDAKNTAEGGCATTNACATSSSSGSSGAVPSSSSSSSSAVVPTPTPTPTPSVAPTSTSTTTTTTTTTTAAPESTTTTTAAPTTTTTAAPTTTPAPCNQPNCYVCATGNANQCLSCVPGMVPSSSGVCIIAGSCFVTGCNQCESNDNWKCQTCFAGYSKTVVGGCARSPSGVSGMPSLVGAAAATVCVSAMVLGM